MYVCLRVRFLAHSHDDPNKTQHFINRSRCESGWLLFSADKGQREMREKGSNNNNQATKHDKPNRNGNRREMKTGNIFQNPWKSNACLFIRALFPLNRYIEPIRPQSWMTKRKFLIFCSSDMLSLIPQKIDFYCSAGGECEESGRQQQHQQACRTFE